MLVAQLDRVTGYEPVGRGFESLQARQSVQLQQSENHVFLRGFLFYVKGISKNTSRFSVCVFRDALYSIQPQMISFAAV